MARIFYDGFDHGSMKLWDDYSGALFAGSAITGPYSLQSGCSVHKDISETDIYDIYFGFWLLHTSSCSGYFSIYPTIGSGVFPNGFKITVYASGIQFAIYSQTGGYTITYGSFMLEYNENNVQIRFKNNQDSSVLVQIKLNGELIVNETITNYGYPLYYCPSATTGRYFDGFEVVIPAASSGYYLDDIVADDADWPGPSRIYTLAPSGVGNSTMWQASSGDNYACVDDIPENTADYVMADDALDLDLYTLENLPVDVVTVKGVQVFALAKTPGSPAYEYLQLALRTGSANYFSSSKNLYYTYRMLFYFWDSNPQTGIEWTVSQINALEAGIRLVTS